MSDKKPEDEGTPTEVNFLKMLDEFAATGITLSPEYVAQLREQYGQSSFGEMRLTRGMAAEFSLTQHMAYRLFELGAVLECPVEVIDATPVDFVEGDDMVDACRMAARLLVPPKAENINLLVTINHDEVVIENQDDADAGGWGPQWNRETLRAMAKYALADALFARAINDSPTRALMEGAITNSMQRLLGSGSPQAMEAEVVDETPPRPTRRRLAIDMRGLNWNAYRAHYPGVDIMSTASDLVIEQPFNAEEHDAKRRQEEDEVRSRLKAENPEMSDEEVEKRVNRNLAKGGWPVGTLHGIIHNRSSSATGKCYCDPTLKAMCTLCLKKQAEQWASKGEKE